MNSDEKKTKKSRASKGRSGSMLGETNRKIYRFVRDGWVGNYLSGYDKTCERYRSSYFAHLFSDLKKRFSADKDNEAREEKKPDGMENVGIYDPDTVSHSAKDRFASAFDSSAIISMMRGLKKMILNTSLVSYGVLVFGFALFMLISQTLTLFLSIYRGPLAILSHLPGEDNVLMITYMAVAVTLMAVSLTLIFAGKGTLYSFLIDSRISGFFLRRFMGIRPRSDRQTTYMRHNGRAFVTGMILGLITFFVPPSLLFAILAIAAFVAVTFNIPEFGLIFLIFVLPFLSLTEHPTVTAALLAALVLIATLLKVFRGKRRARFEPADLYVLLFLGLVLFGGIFTFGGVSSFGSALVLVTMGLMYFSVTILIKDEDWLKRLLNAFLASSCVVAFWGIVEWFFHKQSTIWQDSEVFSRLSGRVVSLWDNPNVLAEYLLVSFFVSFGCLIAKKKDSIKLLSLTSFALSAVCLVLTWSRGAWVAAAAVFLLMLLIRSSKTIPWVTLLVLGSVAAFVFLPDTFVDRVTSIVTFSDSSVIYRINIWKGCSVLVRNCFLTGVGVGQAAFTDVYGDYALAGIESAPHAHNLFLQILIELGFMGLLVFLVLLLMLVRSAFSLFRVRSFDNFSSVMGLAFLSALMALLINGLTEYVWYNNRIYLLFFIIMGLITAARRIGLQKVETPLREPDAYDWRATLVRKRKKRSGQDRDLTE